MEIFLQDLRYAVRMLTKNPGFTFVAIMALAIGIGANSAIFSVINTVLLKELPYKDPNELVMVWETSSTMEEQRRSVSFPNFLDWRENNQVFEHLSSFRYSSRNRTDSTKVTRINVVRAYYDIFELFKINPKLGKTFSLEHSKQQTADVAILSYKYWVENFDSDETIIGKTIFLDKQPLTIIGVLPSDFKFPLRFDSPDIWLPLIDDLEDKERDNYYLFVIGRLKKGISLSKAQLNLETIAKELEKKYPETNFEQGVNIIELREHMVGKVRPALYALFGAVVLVLLIACANVANLLLARAVTREKEIAVRIALGASRLRLIRQFLTESLLLAALGGLLGLILAMWGVDALLSLNQNISRLGNFSLDFRVLSFTFIISVITGIVFGLIPALQTSNPNLNISLKEVRTSSISPNRQRVRNIFVVSEIALALALLISSGLMIKSFWQLQRLDLGFESSNILTAKFSLPSSMAEFDEANKKTSFFQQVLEEINNLPQVEKAALTSPLPLAMAGVSLSLVIEKRPPKLLSQAPLIAWHIVSENYFETLKIPMVLGREFNSQDNEKSSKVVIINQALANKFFPNENPIGEWVTIGLYNTKCQIIGVASNSRNQIFSDHIKPEFYTPYLQTPWNEMALVIRTKTDPKDLIATIHKRVHTIDRNIPIFNVKTIDEMLSDMIFEPRFNTLLLTLFAFVALILASIGIYSVMSYSVGQRTHEIGVRLALGAQKQDIVKLVITQGILLAIIGILSGLTIAYGLTRFLSGLLFGVSSTDLLTFFSVTVFLLLVIILACYIPARRAMCVDPITALRRE